jgi:hypothetical protein
VYELEDVRISFLLPYSPSLVLAFRRARRSSSELQVLIKQENNLVALKVAQTRARISMLRTEMALRAEEAFSREMHMERERERDMARDRERDRAR